MPLGEGAAAMYQRLIPLFFRLSLVVASLVLGCSAGSSTNASSGPGVGGTGGTGGEGGGPGGGGEGASCIVCTGGGAPQNVLIVTPPTAKLDIANGATETQQFRASYNGKDVTTDVTWSFDKPAVGLLDVAGLFTPYGTQGGRGKVTALFHDHKATAFVTVNVEITVSSAGLSPAQQAAFDAPTVKDPALAIVYPYDKVVMPLRVLTPQFQWNGGAANDVYRFRLRSQHITYTEYTTAPPPSSKTLAQK